MPVHDEYARKVLDVFVGSTFRITGRGVTAQTLLALGNASGSGFYLGVRRLFVSMDSTAALTAVAPLLRLYRSDAQPGGGTALTLYTLLPSTRTLSTYNSGLVALQDTASDGGVRTTISGSPVLGNPLWGQFGTRQHTAVGQNLGTPIDMLPDLWPHGQVYPIAPADNLYLRVDASVSTSNPATTHYVVSVELEVYTIQ